MIYFAGRLTSLQPRLNFILFDLFNFLTDFFWFWRFHEAEVDIGLVALLVLSLLALLYFYLLR